MKSRLSGSPLQWKRSATRRSPRSVRRMRRHRTARGCSGRNDLLRGTRSGIRDVDWLGSGNMAVRRAHFVAVGGFDTALHTCEDVDLCRRLRHAGFRIVQDPRLRERTSGRPSTLRDLFRGELWRGRDNLRMSFRGPVKLSELPSAILPIAQLGLLGMAVTGIAAGPAGLPVTGVGLGGILVAAGARAARMGDGQNRRSALMYGQAFAVAATYDRPGRSR